MEKVTGVALFDAAGVVDEVQIVTAKRLAVAKLIVALRAIIEVADRQATEMELEQQCRKSKSSSAPPAN